MDCIQRAASSTTKSDQGLRLIFPKALEPIRAELRVAHRVRDIPMPEVLLNRSRVLALACELEPTRMPQHVRMNLLGKSGARSRDAARVPVLSEMD